MPELAEVETVIRTLEYQCGNCMINKVKIYYEPMIMSENFAENIKGQRICGYHRYGKYLLFELDDYMLIVHLRMEGKFYLDDEDKALNKHIHVVFSLDNHKELRYHDTRKFGKMYLYPKLTDVHEYPCMKQVGLDVFDERLDATYLYNQLHNRHISLKQALLEQKVMAGVGNIYADEIAFAISLHPLTPINHLTIDDMEKLLVATRSILTKAIANGGTTIRSYTSSLGVDGRFQQYLMVHSRENEQCNVCQGVIKKIKANGRGTYFCERCQQIK